MTVDSGRTRGNGFKLRQGRVETLEQVARGGCGCPIPGGIQGHAGCGSGQPGLEVGDPAHSRGLERDDHCGPFQPRPFYDSTTFTAPARSTQPACAQDGSSCAMAQTSLLGHPKEPLSRCSVVFLGISALGWGQTHGVCPSWAHPVRS